MPENAILSIFYALQLKGVPSFETGIKNSYLYLFVFEYGFNTIEIHS